MTLLSRFFVASILLVVLLGPVRPVLAEAVTRGPYLQLGTPTSVVIKWRTDTATDAVVHYGTEPEVLDATAVNTTTETEHEVALSNLTPDRRYYYAIGSSSQTLAGGDASHTFVTSPQAGTDKPTRIWVIGDSGTANSNAAAVRQAYEQFTGTRGTDLWLMLGDNAYPDGTDSEYQGAVFDMYPEILRQTALWPTLGNHDGHTADSDTQSGPYYDIFTLPTDGEAGGMPSGTEAYYSFDYGNIHFISLDSYDTDRSAGGTMMRWLEEDLAATDKAWVFAFWHHPPYSKGSHDSDTTGTMIDMREIALPILEDYGVDLVLSGHSHSYERSFLIDGHYGDSSTLDMSMLLDEGSGRKDQEGAYIKFGGAGAPHEGAVYTVAGSSGKASSGSLDHPAMFSSLKTLGSVVLDIDGDRLDAKFIDATGDVKDYFTVLKNEESTQTNRLQVRIETRLDDAEEQPDDGHIRRGSKDLDIGEELVRLRFASVNIPPGATIANAYVQFQSQGRDSVATSLTIAGEDTDQALTTTKASGDISSRATTEASVAWAPDPWTSVGEAGPDQRTPDIAAIIQAIVNRPGWSSGNALALIISGEGERDAESFDGDQGGAPVLHVESN